VENFYLARELNLTQAIRELTANSTARILLHKDKGGTMERDRAVEELGYWVDIEPWTEEEIRIQAWILRLALESID
jgi:hypothetical protein